jgi:hypothetical protein
MALKMLYPVCLEAAGGIPANRQQTNVAAGHLRAGLPVLDVIESASEIYFVFFRPLRSLVYK